MDIFALDAQDKATFTLVCQVRPGRRWESHLCPSPCYVGSGREWAGTSGNKIKGHPVLQRD